MYTYRFLAPLVLLTACTLPQLEPEPPALPPAPPPSVAASAPALLTLQQDVQALRGDISVLEERVYSLEALPERVARLEEVRATLRTLPRQPEPRRVADFLPVQLIAHAQQEARVEPSERGYWGKNGEYVYQYAPGKIFTIYVAPKMATSLFLPPGEKMVAGLYLSSDDWEVRSERAGPEPLTYDAVTIRPLNAQSPISTFILTESGRRYLLHFITGKVAMLAVTFEVSPVPQVQREEPKLILPRPVQP